MNITDSVTTKAGQQPPAAARPARRAAERSKAEVALMLRDLVARYATLGLVARQDGENIVITLSGVTMLPHEGRALWVPAEAVDATKARLVNRVAASAVEQGRPLTSTAT